MGSIVRILNVSESSKKISRLGGPLYCPRTSTIRMSNYYISRRESCQNIIYVHKYSTSKRPELLTLFSQGLSVQSNTWAK